MKMWPTTHDGATFLRAALDPFADVQLRSVGVPDSFSGNTLKHTNTMEITVVPDSSGNVQFILIPSTSSPLIAKSGSFKNLLLPQIDSSSGLPVGTLNTDFNASTVSEQMNLAIPWPYWAQNYGSATTGQNRYGPYSYKSQRVTSQGLEWRWTGTTLTDQGVCTAAILDSYLVEGFSEYTAAGSPLLPIGPGIEFIQRGDIEEFSNISQSALSNQPQFVQLTMHPNEGSGGYSTMISAEEGYIMKPYAPNTAFISAGSKSSTFNTSASNSLGTLGFNNASTPIPSIVEMAPWQNLRPIGFSFTGLPVSAGAITLRLKQRVEATIDIGSAFQQFTDKSPQEDCNAMAIVANVAKTLPVMVPVTMNGFGDWWKKIMNVIGWGARVAGSLIPVPGASIIGQGVGALADVLGAI